MAKTAKALLDIAAKEVGYNRYTDPEQGTKYGRWYAKLTNSPYFGTTGVPYCAMFVSWCLAQLGIACTGCPTAACTSGLLAAARSRGKLIRVNNALPGDVVLFDWSYGGYGSSSADHTGFCVKNNDGVSLETIEGNVSGQVARRTRPYSCIVGVIRPEYDSAAPTPAPTSITKIGVDGIFGPKTKTFVQQTLQKRGYYKGYVVDGDFGYYSKLELQKYLRAKGYYGTAWLLDGDFGIESTKALQKYLRKLGYYTKEYMAKLGYKNIACLIDGDWGFYTTVALQCALNDGKF